MQGKGKAMSAERERGTMVYPLDRVQLTSYITATMAAIYGEDVSFEVDGFALLEGEDGAAVLLIESEGVGYEFDKVTNRVEVPLMWGMTIGYLTAPAWLKVLQGMKGEPVDLADYVRTFGDRLERNFGIWKRWAREHNAYQHTGFEVGAL